ESAGDLAGRVHVCPIRADSTRGEAEYIRACLERLHPRSVLIVTSDYHTRRALSIARRMMPQYRWSVAASSDPASFGPQWWKHREWAKINFLEWQRLLWWELAERWRS
ncbi:MAG TPA: YdcF family protein, partial [Candidatus Binataceae bacterium]|nr:YdcF family protein [Candidatus Binataceae bacterium]